LASQKEGPSQSGLNIPQLRQSFESQAPTRSLWVEQDYVQLIRRLDVIQTEAFILKGKLLAEAKDRFYSENKNGWIQFCELTLGMNYTTANQYIRVALECDVMSHQYPGLGFEHFKALLPLPVPERPQLLAKFNGGSVKSLRTLVSEILTQSSHTGVVRSGAESTAKVKQLPEGSARAARSLLRHLQNVHAALAVLDMDQLPTKLAWQVSVACGQVASNLMHAARITALAQDLETVSGGNSLQSNPSSSSIRSKETQK
jgi:hypothetical protein